MIAKKNPLVSVVIPTYNHAHFLGRALQSVVNQTYTNWEVILVDNHSKDNTNEVVERFIEPRINLLKIHNDGVIAASRNMGICAAKGEWIAFLDSDDSWYPHKLEIALNGIAENPSVDVCSTDEVLVDESAASRGLLKHGPYCSDFYKRLLLIGNCMSPSATLVRRDFLVKNNILFRENQEFVTAEDYDLWMLLARAGAKFKFIRSVQGEYLIHATNNSGQVQRHRQNVVNVIRDHVYSLQSFQPEKDRLWRNINARLFFANAIALISEKNYVLGIQELILAFQTSFMGALQFFFSKVENKVRSAIP